MKENEIMKNCEEMILFIETKIMISKKIGASIVNLNMSESNANFTRQMLRVVYELLNDIDSKESKK